MNTNQKGRAGFMGPLMYKGKPVTESEVGTHAVVEYTKMVRMTSFDSKAPNGEDLCEGHIWRHRSAKYFRDPLPKNWIYCYKCRTEKLETI